MKQALDMERDIDNEMVTEVYSCVAMCRFFLLLVASREWRSGRENEKYHSIFVGHIW